MTHRNARSARALVAVLAVAIMMMAAWREASAEVLNKVVATVDGEPVTAYELDRFIQQKGLQVGAEGGPKVNEVLMLLLSERMVAKEIERRNVKVGDVEIDRYIDHIRQQNKLEKEQLVAALEQQGMTWEAYRKQVKSEIEKIQLLNREIRGKVNVTPEEIERYYEAHKKDYLVAGRVALRHILIRLDRQAPEPIVEAARERLAGAREKIVDGEDFAEIAKGMSEDGSAAQGGDLGEIEPEKILPEFVAALEKMEDGDVSEPIRTEMGLHLVKLEKRILEGYTPLEELSPKIKEKLYAEALDQRYRRWIEEDLQKRHYVEIKL